MARVNTIKGIASVVPLYAATNVPLHRQLYEGLRSAILSGQLGGGARLPSTRAMSRELGISRTTILIAYQQLLFEGYLEGRHGSGTYVSHALPDSLVAAPLPKSQVHQTPFASVQVDTALRPDAPLSQAFRLGQPALDVFPHALWQRLLSRRYRESWQLLSNYEQAAGYQPLREAIAGYLSTARGVRCTAEQVIVVAGCQQGLDLAARVLLRPGDAAWIEDPGYIGARLALAATGARLISAPVDSAGVDVAAASERCPNARLAYVTPSHEFPLGATMSLTRRLALLEWAQQQNAWILEDDYDSEYRYIGRPLAALQGLDTAGRVLYLGTFSKVLFPALRLGYIIAPPELLDALLAARITAGSYAPTLEQAVVADFITEGHFLRHIRRTRMLYAERQTTLREALERELRGEVAATSDPAGMHLNVWLPDDCDEEVLAQRAAEQGIQVTPLSHFTIEPYPRRAVVLGYAAANTSEIQQGVRKLATALRVPHTR